MKNFESSVDEMNENIAQHFYDSLYGGADDKEKVSPSKDNRL